MFQFLHILTNTYFPFFKITVVILVSVKYYLIMVLIYISLMTNNVVSYIYENIYISYIYMKIKQTHKMHWY